MGHLERKVRIREMRKSRKNLKNRKFSFSQILSGPCLYDHRAVFGGWKTHQNTSKSRRTMIYDHINKSWTESEKITFLIFQFFFMIFASLQPHPPLQMIHQVTSKWAPRSFFQLQSDFPKFERTYLRRLKELDNILDI